jgi:serine/threonine protein kinase
MGIVYKARQPGLDRTVALKMLLPGSSSSPEDIQRFCLEARAAANLDHPNIVSIYDIGQQENQYYFTMAYVEGQSLAGLIRNKGMVLPFKESATIVQVIAEAIQYAHEKGILHRDLKPENILIDTQGRPRVTDFGLARRLQADSRLTAAGQVLGTPSYMAPEQADGKHACGPAVDVYGLGAILYFLLTRRPPFLGETLMETLYKVVHEEVAPPRQHNPAVPVELEAICLKCLRKDPAQRYASAGELATALRQWVGATVAEEAATQPTLPDATGLQKTSLTPPITLRRRRPFWPLAATAVVMGLGIGLGLVYLQNRFGDRPNPTLPDANGGHEQPEREIRTTGFKRPDNPRSDFGLQVELVGE